MIGRWINPGLAVFRLAQAQAERMANSLSGSGAGSLTSTPSAVAGLSEMDGGSPAGPGYGPVPLGYTSNDLWLQITGVSNNLALLALHGTTPELNYEILTRIGLSDTNWNSEGPVLGAAGQDWTAIPVALGTRTNQLFFRARSWVDSDGSGLPDWWQLKYFGHTGVDPYGDPDGDGWTNLQEYQNGTDPTGFNPLPPPQTLALRVDSTGTNMSLVWQSGGGPVIQYKVEAIGGAWAVDYVAASQTSFSTSLKRVYFGSVFLAPRYRVTAQFTGGGEALSAVVSLAEPGLTLDGARLQRDSLGSWWIWTGQLPASVERVRVFWSGGTETGEWFDLPASSFSDGMVRITPAQAAGCADWLLWVQAATGDGRFGAARPIGTCRSGESVNAALHLKENLRFYLRMATSSRNFGADMTWENGGEQWYDYRLGSSPAHEHASFHIFRTDGGDRVTLEPWTPVNWNYLWRNFAAQAPQWAPPASLSYDASAQSWDIIFPSFFWNGDTILVPSPLFTGASFPWLFNPSLDPRDPAARAELGLSVDGDGHLYLQSNATNLYGLPIAGLRVSGSGTLLEPGMPTTLSASNAFGFCARIDAPALQTVAYYFAKLSAGDETLAPLPAVPCRPDFSPTNDQPLLVMGIGQPATIAGWAKQAILNGSSNRFAYLEQYWDKAYQAGTNGIATTNQTGVLSAYGEFLPTEPGMTALVTMPDLDTGARGTGVVNVIKLQLDVNHDGIMDLSFGGQDNTSAARPFTFWINNDHDEPGTGGNADQDLVVPPNRPDYTYGNIRCQRNLEDLARLWICGLPKLPPSQGYTVTLSMSPSSGNPAINLYAAYGTNSGTGYLKNTNVAAAQFTKVYLGDQLMTDYAKSVAQISASQSYNLPLSSDGTPPYTNFLFEGVGTNSSSGQLILTVSQTTAQGSNVLAQTSTWLELHDIKDFYERVVITNITTGAISNWSSGIEVVQYPVVSDANESHDIVVFVHGINNTVTDWLTSSDTMFKRLYWSGYHGKFATIHWPCKYLPPTSLHPFDFNLSEFYAYKSTTAFKAYLHMLTTRFPGYRIHVVAHSQGNALASEALSEGAPFDTYILTQAAMPASCYDVQAPTLAKLVAADTPPAGEPTPEWTTMGYRGAHTNLVGQIVNYYNALDYALATGAIQPVPGLPAIPVSWEQNQYLSKPDGLPGARNYTSDGTNGYAVIDVGLFRLVTDSEECRGMVARSRTKAIGALGPVAGQSSQGVIGSGVDLNAQFGFGTTRDEHSAEFKRSIQTARPYYLQLLRSCQIQPAE